MGLELNTEYQPVAKIWTSRPVRHFVTYIKRMGWSPPGETGPMPVEADDDGKATPVRTASRPSDDKTTTEQRSVGEEASSPATARSSAAEASGRPK